jgi:hypothetical protein
MKGDYHEDARFGFKVKPPKDWQAIPVPSGQSWLIGKYLSKKKYFYTEPGSYTFEFQPEMAIVAFVSEDLKRAARKKALDETKDEEAKKKLEWEHDLEKEAGFRDFKDYLDKTYTDGGFYFSKEEPGELSGIRTMVYEANVEKMARSGPKRILAWVYSLPDVDIAVKIEVLEQDYDKLRTTLESTLKSLRPIAREGEMPLRQGGTGSATAINVEDMDEMTAEQRKQVRLASQEDAHAKAIAGLADGWHHSKIDGFLLISHTDERFDKQVAEQARTVFDWLDKTFPYVGPGEYVREPIIRVCRTWDEEKSFRADAGGLDLFGLSLEVTTNQEDAGTRSFESGFLNQSMTRLWFNDRDRELWWLMPAWLREGIVHALGDATPKGGKLDFYRGDWTAETLRTLVREERATHPRELVYMIEADFHGDDGRTAFERAKQAQALVDYLLLGPGAKSSKTKNLLQSYVTNVKAVILELKEEGKELAKDEEKKEKPKTEEEEEAALKAEREAWVGRQRQLLEEVGRRTFTGWTEKDWDDLAKSYFKTF